MIRPSADKRIQIGLILRFVAAVIGRHRNQIADPLPVAFAVIIAGQCHRVQTRDGRTADRIEIQRLDVADISRSPVRSSIHKPQAFKRRRRPEPEPELFSVQIKRIRPNLQFPEPERKRPERIAPVPAGKRDLHRIEIRMLVVPEFRIAPAAGKNGAFKR